MLRAVYVKKLEIWKNVRCATSQCETYVVNWKLVVRYDSIHRASEMLSAPNHTVHPPIGISAWRIRKFNLDGYCCYCHCFMRSICADVVDDDGACRWCRCRTKSALEWCWHLIFTHKWHIFQSSAFRIDTSISTEIGKNNKTTNSDEFRQYGERMLLGKPLPVPVGGLEC